MHSIYKILTGIIQVQEPLIWFQHPPVTAIPRNDLMG